MSNMKNIPGKIYLQIGDECDSEDFNELSEVSWCKDKIYDNDIEFALQNQMDNITEKEIKNLEDILLHFSEAHNMLAKTSLSKEEYQPISGLLAKAKVELFNFYNEHKAAALQNKVSDISAEGILDKYYKPKMHWKVVNRKNVLAAMHEYASIVNERKDSAGSSETSNEVLNEVLGIAVKAHLFKQLTQMDDFIEEMKKFENFEIKKKVGKK